jgi:hypothetical protein
MLVRLRPAAQREVKAVGDPFLNYFALFLLIFVVVVLFYGIIAIHDIPHMIAKSRGHPHQDAIHAAGWVSLFTLHVLWPFLWIWAMAYRPERGWGFSDQRERTGSERSEMEDLRRRIEELERKAPARERKRIPGPERSTATVGPKHDIAAAE